MPFLHDGTIRECSIFNEQYPYSSDRRLGGFDKDAKILPHEFYDIAVSDIAYLKLINLDIWTNINYKATIVASGYEIELYRAE